MSATSRPGRRDDLAEEVVDRVVQRRCSLRLHPGRVRRADDDPVAGLDCLRHLAEVLQLRVVEVGRPLRVDGEQPPALRQLEREVAAGLLGLPAADAAARRAGRTAAGTRSARRTSRGCRAARRGSGSARSGGCGQRRPVRAPNRSSYAVPAGGRVDLVAAQHQHLPPRGSVCAADRRSSRLRQQVGHRVGGVEPVAEVGDVVEPELLVLWRVVVDLLGERVLQLALVEVGAELFGEGDPGAGGGEQDRAQPGTGCRGANPSSSGSNLEGRRTKVDSKLDGSRGSGVAVTKAQRSRLWTSASPSQPADSSSPAHQQLS